MFLYQVDLAWPHWKFEMQTKVPVIGCEKTKVLLAKDSVIQQWMSVCT